MEFRENSPATCEGSTEKFRELETRIEGLLRSAGSSSGGIQWKVKLHAESSCTTYIYSLSQCPFCGKLSAIIALTEDAGTGMVHAVMMCNSLNGVQCQEKLDAILFKE